MANELVKTIKTQYLPGYSGQAAIPGTPARAAYTSNDPVYSCRTEYKYFAPPPGSGGVVNVGGSQNYNGTQPQGYYYPVTVCETRYVETYHPAVAAVAPQPAIPAVASQTLLDYNFGWNAGGRTTRQLEGNMNGSFLFRLPNAVGAVVGLATTDPDGSFYSMSHAVRVQNNVASIIEFGVQVYGVGTVNNPLWTIRRRNKRVEYLMNGTVIYTSWREHGGTVFLDASLYAGGDRVQSVTMATQNGAELRIEPLDMTGSNTGFKKQAKLSMLPMGMAGGSRSAEAALVLEPMSLYAGQGAKGQATAMMPRPLLSASGSTSSAPAPTYAVFDGVSAGMTMAGHGITGEVGQATLVMSTMSAYGGEGSNRGQGLMVMPALYGFGHNFEGNFGAFISAGVGTAAPLAGGRYVAIVMTNDLRVSHALIFGAFVNAEMTERLRVEDVFTNSALINALMEEVLRITDGMPLPDDTSVWVVDRDTGASVRFEQYAFTSFAQIDGQYYGIKSDGIYKLEGDADDGAPIRAYANFGKPSFNEDGKCFVSEVFVGTAASGALVLRVTDDEGEVYDYTIESTEEHLTGQRFVTGRGLRGTYLNFELFNVDGADFEIDKMVATVVPSTKRRIQ